MYVCVCVCVFVLKVIYSIYFHKNNSCIKHNIIKLGTPGDCFNSKLFLC